MKRSRQNEFSFLWDLKQDQIKLTAGGTIAVIAVAAAATVFFLLRHFF